LARRMGYYPGDGFTHPVPPDGLEASEPSGLGAGPGGDSQTPVRGYRPGRHRTSSPRHRCEIPTFHGRSQRPITGAMVGLSGDIQAFPMKTTAVVSNSPTGPFTYVGPKACPLTTSPRPARAVRGNDRALLFVSSRTRGHRNRHADVSNACEGSGRKPRQGAGRKLTS
jgi:hypothetical protein